MLTVNQFKEAQCCPLDLNLITPTTSLRDIVIKLFSSDVSRVLYCPKSRLGSADFEQTLITGAALISVDKTHLYFEQKMNGHMILKLFRAGVISVDNDVPKQTPKSVIFKLSPAVEQNRRVVYRFFILRPIKRVTMPNLKIIAEAYGLRINYKPTYKIFQILQRDGSRITRNDYLFTHPKTGEPIVKINDLTMLEWDDVFYYYYLKSENKSLARERLKQTLRDKKMLSVG